MVAARRLQRCYIMHKNTELMGLIESVSVIFMFRGMVFNVSCALSFTSGNNSVGS